MLPSLQPAPSAERSPADLLVVDSERGTSSNSPTFDSAMDRALAKEPVQNLESSDTRSAMPERPKARLASAPRKNEAPHLFAGKVSVPVTSASPVDDPVGQSD